MEMIDVLKKLEEIAQTRPELVADAVDNVSRTNPAQVNDNAVKAEAGMSDVHIGAQEVVGEYADEDGNLKMPKAETLQAMAQAKAKAAFPDSYEIETAMGMVNDKFNDAGQPIEDMPEPDMQSEVPTQEPEALEGNAFAQAVTQAKAAGMKKGDKFKVGDEEHTLRDSDFEGESTRDMTTEKTEGKIPAGLKAYQDKKAGKEDKKETVKESIQISTDSPQEASMMMQILKLAGVQQVDPAMINQEPEHGSDMDPGALNKQMDVPDDDAMGSMQMAKMRDMMTAPAEEKAEETFANSLGDEKEEPKIQDTDTLVNTMSGGMNRQKKTYPKVASGDNPMAAEDKITEHDLANSLRSQYEGFKEAYHKKAKMDEAPKPDFLDMDKDGDKKEPMKKAIKDKEAK